MNCARNYENLLNFVQVMLKILVVPFISRHSVHVYTNSSLIVYMLKKATQWTGETCVKREWFNVK